jgi:hypothetical protein
MGMMTASVALSALANIALVGAYVFPGVLVVALVLALGGALALISGCALVLSLCGVLLFVTPLWATRLALLALFTLPTVYVLCARAVETYGIENVPLLVSGLFCALSAVLVYACVAVPISEHKVSALVAAKREC